MCVFLVRITGRFARSHEPNRSETLNTCHHSTSKAWATANILLNVWWHTHGAGCFARPLGATCSIDDSLRGSAGNSTQKRAFSHYYISKDEAT